MVTENKEYNLVYIPYKGDTCQRELIVDADLESGKFIETGYLDIGSVYTPSAIVDVLHGATHCLERGDRVNFYRLKLEDEVIYDGDTFGKPFITEAQAVKEGFKVFAHLIIGWGYKGKDIESIRTRSVYHYVDRKNVYFYIQE